MLLKSSDTPTFYQKFFNFKTSSSPVISMARGVLNLQIRCPKPYRRTMTPNR